MEKSERDGSAIRDAEVGKKLDAQAVSGLNWELASPLAL